MFARPLIARHRASFSPLDLAVLLAAATTVGLVMMPSISAFFTASREIRAERTCYTIGAAVARFYRDWDATAAGPGSWGTSARRFPFDLLVSQGDRPIEARRTEWSTGHVSTLTEYLVNRPTKPTQQADQRFDQYIDFDPGPDPWGHRYLVNVGLLGPASPSPPHEQPAAVWVLSAGPNGTIDTPYRQPVGTASLGGDDIGARIQ
ncbi:MAG: hypothetical protein AB1806_08320 [Acidobacteriota bacterium]